MLFMMFVSFFVGAVFILALSGFRLDFSKFSIWLTLIMAIILILYNVLGILILSMGTVAIYSMFMMLGGMFLPTLYGVIFLRESLSAWQIIAYCLLLFFTILPTIRFNKNETEGRVRILPYNIVGRTFYTETGSGKQDVQLIRYVECAGDKNTWLYTEDNNDKTKTPYFESTAKVNQIEIFDDNTVKTGSGEVIFPDGERQYLRLNIDSACDNDGIEAYKLYVYKKENNRLVTFKQLYGSRWKETDFIYLNSRYYATPIPKSFSVIASGLEHLETGAQYEIQIYAVDMYHNISENKLTCSFTFDGTKCIVGGCEVK